MSLLRLSILATLLAACASSGRVTTATATGEVADSFARPPASAPVVIRVTSAFAGPLALYTVSEGVATHLGDLSGARSAEFHLTATEIPSNGITLLAVPRTGDARASAGGLRVAPGSIVDFTIGAQLTDARATVRSP